MKLKRYLNWLTIAALTLCLAGCAKAAPQEPFISNNTPIPSESAIQEEINESDFVEVDEEKEYSSKEEVAAYLIEYGHLPSNFITKKEAKKLGWDSREGNLWEVAPGKSIGGDYYGNYEEQLPKVKGRKYYECDINYEGGYRGAERIIYSNDGAIYYTDDHYETFEQLAGEEE